MHLPQLIPFLVAVLVLAVIFYFANAAEIIQPVKSIILAIVVLIVAYVLLNFVGIHVPL